MFSWQPYSFFWFYFQVCNMENQDALIRIYAGTEMAVYMLKALLEEMGIGVLIRNDYESGIRTGFFGGTTSSIYVFIQQADLEKAQPIIEEFLKNNPH